MQGRAIEPREAFGYAIMGPILAEMLWKLSEYLQSSKHAEDSTVFFCARGGFTLRRTLDLFASRVGFELRLRQADLMISRLAAARAALHRDSAAVAPLVEKEFAGRSCAEAAQALAGVCVNSDPRWNVPFSLARFTELIGTTESGQLVRRINNEQAELLRTHIEELRAGSSCVILCDTGVFGSIGRYLQVGLPHVNWNSILLFRANYKHIPAPHFKITTGLISEWDAYIPWRPVTAILLYWQVMESMLEPDVPSVQYYRSDAACGVVSDLQIANWQDCLKPAAGSVLAGALRYVAELSPQSIGSLHSRGRLAWNRLRRMIVFPTRDDVALLAVGRRPLGFGVNDSVTFTNQLDTAANSFRDKLSTSRCSMWPEGELRKQFPRTAGVFLLMSEMARFIRATYRTIIANGSHADSPRNLKISGLDY
jgi:hypothetical protein